MKFSRMQLVLQPRIRVKDSQKPLKDLVAMHQKQHLGQGIVSTFPIINQTMLSIKIFPKTAFYFESIVPKNTESRLFKYLSKTFDKFDNMLTGL